jgi:hypothetical protein
MPGRRGFSQVFSPISHYTTKLYFLSKKIKSADISVKKKFFPGLPHAPRIQEIDDRAKEREYGVFDVKDKAQLAVHPRVSWPGRHGLLGV